MDKPQRSEWFKSYRNRPGVRETMNMSMRAYMKRTRLRLIEVLGNKCSQCGFTDMRCLQIDHINGYGHKTGHSYHTDIRYYLKHPEEAKQKLQVLCANCNWIKKHENNEVPRMKNLIIK